MSANTFKDIQFQVQLNNNKMNASYLMMNSCELIKNLFSSTSDIEIDVLNYSSSFKNIFLFLDGIDYFTDDDKVYVEYLVSFVLRTELKVDTNQFMSDLYYLKFFKFNETVEILDLLAVFLDEYKKYKIEYIFQQISRNRINFHNSILCIDQVLLTSYHNIMQQNLSIFAEINNFNLINNHDQITEPITNIICRIYLNY